MSDGDFDLQAKARLAARETQRKREMDRWFDERDRRAAAAERQSESTEATPAQPGFFDRVKAFGETQAGGLDENTNFPGALGTPGAFQDPYWRVSPLDIVDQGAEGVVAGIGKIAETGLKWGAKLHGVELEEGDLETVNEAFEAPIRGMAAKIGTIQRKLNLGRGLDKALVDEPAETIGGDLAGSMGELAAGMLVISPLLKTVTAGSWLASNYSWLNSEILATASGQVVFDAHEAGLVNLLQEGFGLDNAFINAAAKTDSDSEMVARTKQLGEDFAIGVVMNAFPLFRRLKSSRAWKKVGEEMEIRKGILPRGFRTDLDNATNAVTQQRHHVDDIMTLREHLRAMEEGSPAIAEARQYLELPDEDAYAALSKNALAHVKDAEFRAGPEGDALAMLDETTAAARGDSPMSFLDQVDPETASEFRALHSGQEPQSLAALDAALRDARAELKFREAQWRQQVGSDTFINDLSAAEQKKYHAVTDAARRSRTQGARLIEETEQSYRDLEIMLQAKNQPVPANVRQLPVDPRLTDAEKALNIKVRSGPLRGITAGEKLDMVEAMRNGDVGEAVKGSRLADGTNLNHVIESSDNQGIAKLLTHLGEQHVAAGGVDVRPHAVARAEGLSYLDEALELGHTDARQLELLDAELFEGMGKNLPADSRLFAVRMLETGIMERAVHLSDMLEMAPGNLRFAAELNQTLELAAKVNGQRRGMVTDYARAVSSMQAAVTDELLDPAHLREYLRESGNDIGLIAKKIREGSFKSLKELTDRSFGEKLGSAAYSAWINGLLAGTGTFMANATSNAAMAFWVPTTRMLAAFTRRDLPGMMAHGRQMRKLITASGGAWKVTARAFARNEGQLVRFGHSNIPDLPSHGPFGEFLKDTAKPGGLGQQTTGHQIAWAFDTTLGMPSRLLMTADEFAKNVNYAAEADMLAMSHVRQYKPELEGAALEAEVRVVMENMANYRELSNLTDDLTKIRYQEMHEQAIEYAKRTTFTQELKPGTAGKTIERIRMEHPWSKVFIPFHRTLTNIFREGVDHIPGVSMARAEVKEAFASGDKVAISEIRAKWMMGGSIMSMFGAMWFADRVTGKPPSDPRQRAAYEMDGKKPYSFKAFGQWHRYDRIQPVGLMISLMVDTFEVISELDDAEAGDVAMSVMASLVNNIANATWVSGAMDFADAFDSRSGAELDRFMQRRAGGMVPMSGILNTVRQIDDPAYREVRSVIDAIWDRIPGLSNNLEPQLNVFNEVRTKSAGTPFSAINPLYSRDAETDPFMRRMAEIAPDIDMRAYRFIQRPDGEMIELTAKQQNEWIALASGKLGQSNGPTLKDVLKGLMTQPGFTKDHPDEFTPDQQAKILSDVIASRRESTRDMIIARHPEVAAEFHVMGVFSQIEGFGKLSEQEKYTRARRQANRDLFNALKNR